jgi:hypothetical protein
MHSRSGKTFVARREVNKPLTMRTGLDEEIILKWICIWLSLETGGGLL